MLNKKQNQTLKEKVAIFVFNFNRKTKHYRKATLIKKKRNFVISEQPKPMHVYLIVFFTYFFNFS